MERTKPRSSVGTPVPIVPGVSPHALAAILHMSPILLLMDGPVLAPWGRGLLPGQGCGGLWGLWGPQSY